jgi:hypothetical protein
MKKRWVLNCGEQDWCSPNNNSASSVSCATIVTVQVHGGGGASSLGTVSWLLQYIKGTFHSSVSIEILICF